MTSQLIAISAALSLLTLSGCWLALRLLQTNKTITALSHEIVCLQDQLHAQGTGISGMGNSLRRVQAQQQADSGQIEQLEKSGQFAGDVALAGGTRVYQHAINLAVDGIEPRELEQRFGLSRGEAELMVSFHQPGEQAA